MPFLSRPSTKPAPPRYEYSGHAPMYPMQEDAFFNESRYSLIEASTKAGKTYGGLVWWTHKAILEGAPGKEYWWVAPVSRQANIAFSRLCVSLEAVRDGVDIGYSGQTVRLPNGAMLRFRSGEKPDNLYGDDVYAAVIDEASRVREESWEAVRSTLTATRGQARIIGNVHGKRNWFYRLCREAEAGTLPDAEYHRITARDAANVGVIAAEEIEDARATLTERRFRELYEVIPSEDYGNPFGESHIYACQRDGLSNLPAVSIGIDLAKSVDWTVIVSLDENGRVCEFERFQLPWEQTFQRLTAAVERNPQASILVDSTGVGDPIVEQLEKHSGRLQGVKFTAQSKQQLMERLGIAIQTRAITYPGGEILGELLSFSYEVMPSGHTRYEAETGHDDCVCALALAVKAQDELRGLPTTRFNYSFYDSMANSQEGDPW